MLAYTSLLSSKTDDARRLKIIRIVTFSEGRDPDGEEVLATLREIATKWVCDEVGRNNFVDTLDNPTEQSTWRVGTYMLTWTADHAAIDLWWVAATTSGVWPFSGEVPAPKLLGQFAWHRLDASACDKRDADELCVRLDNVRSTCQRLEEVIGETDKVIGTREYECAKLRIEIDRLNKRVRDQDQEMALLREDAIYAVKTHKTPQIAIGRSDAQDSVIEQIKAFDRSSLRRAGSANH